MTFRKELEGLLNRYSMENGSDTPDRILAEFLSSCLDAFDKAVLEREVWYGRRSSLSGAIEMPSPVRLSVDEPDAPDTPDTPDAPDPPDA